MTAQDSSPCLACGSRITHRLYHPEPQPMGMINLPFTPEEAESTPRLPLNFRRCAFCGHIFNIEFDYDKIPYQVNTNLMFNRGKLWMEHLNSLVDRLIEEHDAAGKTLIDIGCGDGLFLHFLLKKSPTARCIGFEPGIEAENARQLGLEVYRDYFVPQRDLPAFMPDILICRHVLEHLQAPSDFLREIAYWSYRSQLTPLFLGEVPRIEEAAASGRIADFLYEHVSNFTQKSFRTLFQQSGFKVEKDEACYGNEVIVLWGRPHQDDFAEIEEESAQFRGIVEVQQKRVRRQLEHWHRLGKTVAFWGAASKGAAFLNLFGVDRDRFPLVVDSDPQKLGRFVPGMGQEIRSPEFIRLHPPEIVVITTRWRARDIVGEMHRRKIVGPEIYVLQDSCLSRYEEKVHEPETSTQKQLVQPPHFIRTPFFETNDQQSGSFS